MKNYTYDELYWMQEAMMQHGGSFVKSLGHTWRRADSFNSQRLLVAFPEYAEQYVKLGKDIESQNG